MLISAFVPFNGRVSRAKSLATVYEASFMHSCSQLRPNGYIEMDVPHSSGFHLFIKPNAIHWDIHRKRFHQQHLIHHCSLDKLGSPMLNFVRGKHASSRSDVRFWATRKSCPNKMVRTTLHTRRRPFGSLLLYWRLQHWSDASIAPRPFPIQTLGFWSSGRDEGPPFAHLICGHSWARRWADGRPRGSIWKVQRESESNGFAPSSVHWVPFITFRCDWVQWCERKLLGVLLSRVPFITRLSGQDHRHSFIITCSRESYWPLAHESTVKFYKKTQAYFAWHRCRFIDYGVL